ncbi:aminoglycoside phosphotransferase family protein, partial [Streptomyces tricolor]
MAFEAPRRLVRALGETAPAGDDWLARLPATAEQAVAPGGGVGGRGGVSGGG